MRSTVIVAIASSVAGQTPELPYQGQPDPGESTTLVCTWQRNAGMERLLHATFASYEMWKGVARRSTVRVTSEVLAAFTSHHRCIGGLICLTLYWQADPQIALCPCHGRVY